MNKTCFYLAPIQGITDFTFRNVFDRHFDGISKYYTPFIRYSNNEIRRSQLVDINLKNNDPDKVIPQILSNKGDEILQFARIVKDFGYKEFNWNLGCPYPMVVNRKQGSGMLPFPDMIEKTLEQIFEYLPLKLSVKLRLGYENNTEIYPVLEILNKYGISEIIIHPRIGKQEYKGTADIEMFENCRKSTEHITCYNGDIIDLNGFRLLSEKLVNQDTFMVGRGAISNPFLIEELSGKAHLPKEIRMERFSNFQHELFESYTQHLSGPGHLIKKMEQLWGYFSKSFDNQHKVYKLIKKANRIEKYESAIYQIFNEFEFTN